MSRLDSIHSLTPITTVIHGAAKGVDSIAGEWARSHRIEEISVPANWAKHGKSAGPIRNAEMLKLKPECVISFPGGRGTFNMRAQTRQVKIPLIIIETDEAIWGQWEKSQSVNALNHPRS